MAQKMNSSLEFTTNWFEGTRATWDRFIPQINPARILEIGSYEGASACYLIDKIGSQRDMEIHCVDTWEGGVEHQSGGVYRANMGQVERRFLNNTRIASAAASHAVELIVHKGCSDVELSKLLASGKKGFFDFIYIDGSHQAPDVLCDALLSFKLLRRNGVLAFDDYLWRENTDQASDPLHCPKPAIDAFTHIFFHKTRILKAPIHQLYVQKISD
jgi:predicted O-methyltransferase YrrM